MVRACIPVAIGDNHIRPRSPPTRFPGGTVTRRVNRRRFLHEAAGVTAAALAAPYAVADEKESRLANASTSASSASPARAPTTSPTWRVKTFMPSAM